MCVEKNKRTYTYYFINPLSISIHSNTHIVIYLLVACVEKKGSIYFHSIIICIYRVTVHGKKGSDSWWNTEDQAYGVRCHTQFKFMWRRGSRVVLE